MAATEPAYAGLGKRSLAFVIDSAVWLFVIAQIMGAIPERTYDDEPILTGIVFLVLLSLWFNYFWLAEWRWGKTIGKAVVRIHVAAEGGDAARFGPTTVRNLLRLVDVLVIGPVLIGSSDRRQRLGDRLAHTVVLRDRPRFATKATNPRIAAAAAGGPDVELGGALPAPQPPPAPAPGNRSPWARSIGIPEPEWGPTKVLWGTLAVLGLLVVESGIVAAIDPELESTGSQLAIQGLLAVNLIAVSLGLASVRRSPIAGLRRLGLRGFALSALGLTAATYVAYIVFSAIWFVLVQPEQEDVTRELGFDEGGLTAVIGGFLIVAAAPLSEEVFFRGFMFGGLRRRLPMWAAAGISGVVFGLVHYTGPDSIGVVPQLAALGFLLAWLYERTGSLWPPILLHLLNNSLALVVIVSS